MLRASPAPEPSQASPSQTAMDSSAASDSTFTHEPLPDPARYIRLLEVLNDEYSKTIKVQCKLTTWPIGSAPPYHAISYTWGDPNSNAFILMNDETLQVRTNCEFALKQAYWYKRSQSYWYRKRRSRWFEESRPEWYSESRYYWLDAICIDQTNLGEKSKQVAMMGSIYKNASHVLACIGDHADDSQFFFQTLYGPMHHVVQARTMFRPASDDVFGQQIQNRGISLKFRLLHRYTTTHRFVLALARLATRPYFTRMWILQELQHAQHITILCGQYVLPKEDAIHLFSGVSIGLAPFDQNIPSRRICFVPYFHYATVKFKRRLVNHGLPHPVWHGDWIRGLPKECWATVVMLRQEYMTVGANIFQLLKDVVLRLRCEDPRDKVYGIISLINWGDIPPLEPDYTHNDVEVAIRFIEAIIQLGKSEELGDPIWNYLIITIKLLGLNIQSRSFSEALDARRRAPGDWSQVPAMVPVKGASVRLQQHGWRLSPEDIDENSSKLQDLKATPPKYPRDIALFLPQCSRVDDWVIEVETGPAKNLWYERFDAGFQRNPTYIPLLIMREGAQGHCNALVGYGFYSPLNIFNPPSFKQDEPTDVDIHFDIEDAIIFLSKMKQLYELQQDSKDWIVDFLDTGVCKQQALGSSWVILPPKPPARGKRVLRKTRRKSRPPECTVSINALRTCTFVLWDTKDRRGWLVNGLIVALQLLIAYLKNTPQKEPFDFSRLEHFDETSPEAAEHVLADWDNRSIPIFRVSQAPEHGESSKSGGTIVDEKIIGEVLAEIYLILFDYTMDPPYGTEKIIRRRRSAIVKGMAFERIYRSNRPKVCAHEFETVPAWLGFVEDIQAKFIFGSDLGEVLQQDGPGCPHFKNLPKGQDYLAVPLHKLQELVDGMANCGAGAKSEKPARLSYYFTWEYGPRPFSHLHGQVDHLAKVDSSCFPVQKTVKMPSSHAHIPKKELALMKKRKPRLYSVQDVEDFNAAVDINVNEDADSNLLPPRRSQLKAGMVVFGKRPDGDKLRQLAQASH